MTIKEFSRLCGCNPQTLRYYDHVDLLKPVKVDSWTGYRYRSGRLSNSAFLIAYRNRFAVRHFVRPPFVKFIAIAVWLCT